MLIKIKRKHSWLGYVACRVCLIGDDVQDRARGGPGIGRQGHPRGGERDCGLNQSVCVSFGAFSIIQISGTR